MEANKFEQQIDNQLKRFENAIGEEIFVRDGIVNVAEYLKAPIKVLWILKEANSPKNELDDMRPCLATLYDSDTDKIHSDWVKTWRPIARCVYGIFENKNFATIENVEENESGILKHIKKIAHINVKKCAGGASAVSKEIQNFYIKHKSLLHEQIEIINPDIMIFGGTFGYFADYFENKEKVQESIPVYKFKNKLLIDIYHPNNRTMKQEIYCDSIINAVKNWKQKQ